MKTTQEQLRMTIQEARKYVKHHSLSDEAELKFLTDVESLREYVKRYPLCDKAELKFKEELSRGEIK